MAVPKQVVVSVPDLSVVARKIAPGAVLSSKIANAAVTSEKLAPNAVTGSKIADGSITAAKIDSEAATSGFVLQADGGGGAAFVSPGGGGGNAVKDSNLTGQVDGFTTLFTGPEAYIAGTLWVYRSGQKLIRGLNYTETSPVAGTFTTGETFASGERLEIVYQT